SLPFLEAIRQFGNEVGRANVLFAHVTLVPYLSTSEEHKTKPTQHSVAELRSHGIHPDVIIVRSDRPIDNGVTRKISLFCDVEERAVIPAPDEPDIYQVPLTLHAAGLDRSEEHTSELQSRENLVCRLLLEKKKNKNRMQQSTG